MIILAGVIFHPTYNNVYMIQVEILTGEKSSSIQLDNMEHIYWSVRPSSKRGGDGIKGVDGGYRYFSQLKVLLYHSTYKSGATPK